MGNANSFSFLQPFLNQNIKSVGPDGTTLFHDDSNLMLSLLGGQGSGAPTNPGQAAVQATGKPTTGTPAAKSSGGASGGGFNPGLAELLPLILGQLAGAVAPGSVGGNVGGVFAQFAQNQLFNQFLKSLGGGGQGQGAGGSANPSSGSASSSGGGNFFTMAGLTPQAQLAAFGQVGREKDQALRGKAQIGEEKDRALRGKAFDRRSQSADITDALNVFGQVGKEKDRALRGKAFDRSSQSANITDFLNTARAFDLLQPDAEKTTRPITTTIKLKKLSDGRVAPDGEIFEVGYNSETNRFDLVQGTVPDNITPRPGGGSGDRSTPIKSFQLDSIEANLLTGPFFESIKEGLEIRYGEEITSIQKLMQSLTDPLSGSFNEKKAKIALGHDPKALELFLELVAKATTQLSGEEVNLGTINRDISIEARTKIDQPKQDFRSFTPSGN